MKRKVVSGIMLTLLLISMLTLAFNIQLVRADGTIYIRADGSVDPLDAPISSVDNVTYTFTANIYDNIVVERSNIIVDGANFVVQGTLALWSKGLTLSGISNVTTRDVQVKKFYYGIYLSGSSYNSVFRNNITNNYYYGIYLLSSSNNSISGNNITNNGGGIRLYSSSNNSISGNNITNNWDGIYLYSSSNNTLRNNRMSGNHYNFGVDGFGLSHFIHNVDSSNTVDGKPVCYWVNHQNEVVPTDAGYVALVNSTNITVKNLDLKNNGEGILLAFTKNSTIAGNNITNNNYYGIYLYSSSNNSISGNNITNNSNFGIFLDWSSNNTIYENNITNNWDGIYLYSSSNNIIHHNNFINNAKQVVSYDSINTWDDGYPSGGNYWSDYSGVDHYSGPYQDVIGNDGIGDTPYTKWGIVDHYPIMEPWTPLPRTIGELKTQIEELGSEGEIDNQGIVKSLIAKLKVTEKLVDKGKTEEAEMVLEDFIIQVQELSEIHITVEATDILIESAEYIQSHL